MIRTANDVFFLIGGSWLHAISAFYVVVDTRPFSSESPYIPLPAP